MKCTFPSVSLLLVSPCLMSRTPTVLPTVRPLSSTRRTSGSTRSACLPSWSKAVETADQPAVLHAVLPPCAAISVHFCPRLWYAAPPPTNHQKQLSDFSLHALYIHPPLHRIFYFARQKGFTVFLSLRTLNLALTLLRWICGTLLHSELLITQE